MLTPHLLGWIVSEQTDFGTEERDRAIEFAFDLTKYHHEFHVGFRAEIRSDSLMDISLEDE